MAGFPRFSYVGGMNDLNQHYRDLLGLDDSWNVDEVDLDLTGTQVVIHLAFAGSELSCPECG